MIRVLVADDSTAMRAAIQIRLEKEPDIRVIGEASDYDQAVKLLPVKKPDVFVCDLRMPRGPRSQPSHLAELARVCRCAVIAVTFTDSDDEIKLAAERLGVDRILDITTLFDTLVPAIREAVAEERDAYHF